MATVDPEITVRLRLKDEATPVLRRLMFEAWVMQHPRIAAWSAFVGWFCLGFIASAALGLHF